MLIFEGREFSYGVKYDLNSRAEFLWFHGLISNSAFKSQVKMATSPYEEAPRIKIEENTKRMEALNLPSLSQSLHKSSSATSKPSSFVKGNWRKIFEIIHVLLTEIRASLGFPVVENIVTDTPLELVAVVLVE
ncbi:hypothetical protein QL285_037869 [Trifolium repens]|nr:hypothetical protein QL285_037869 [Trifolium repens]